MSAEQTALSAWACRKPENKRSTFACRRHFQRFLLAAGNGRRESRFKPRQSGNPSGSYRGSKNLNSILRQATINAMKGDPKAIKTMLTLMDQIDLWEEEKISTELVVRFV
jgi:hypothetical protein